VTVRKVLRQNGDRIPTPRPRRESLDTSVRPRRTKRVLRIGGNPRKEKPSIDHSRKRCAKRKVLFRKSCREGSPRGARELKEFSGTGVPHETTRSSEGISGAPSKKGHKGLRWGSPRGIRMKSIDQRENRYQGPALGYAILLRPFVERRGTLRRENRLFPKRLFINEKWLGGKFVEPRGAK